MDIKLIGLVGLLSSVGCMVNLGDLDQGVKGSGKEATEHRSVGNFTKIDTKGAFDVNVTIGNSTSVDITGDDNLLKLVTAKVENGTLTLSSEKNLHPKKELVVNITTPDLSSFSLMGAGDVDIQGVHAKDFSLDLLGAGNLSAKGTAVSVDATLKGAGDMKLFDLHADNVDADLSGAGNMDVYATKDLKAKVAGVGNLTYKGHPASVEKSKNGIGNIESED